MNLNILHLKLGNKYANKDSHSKANFKLKLKTSRVFIRPNGRKRNNKCLNEEEIAFATNESSIGVFISVYTHEKISN